METNDVFTDQMKVCRPQFVELFGAFAVAVISDSCDIVCQSIQPYINNVFRIEIYRCQICGNVVEVVNPGAVLSCCGEPMKLMKENTSDGAKEKHVPVIEPIEGGYRVTVGSVNHPMLPEHYIQWIELLTPTDVLRHELKPGEKPEAIFLTNAEAKDVTAREYCNLHGLWKGVI